MYISKKKKYVVWSVICLVYIEFLYIIILRAITIKQYCFFYLFVYRISNIEIIKFLGIL